MNNAVPSQSDKMLTMGVIIGAHGIKGHVKIKAFNEDPDLLKSFGSFTDSVTGGSINIDEILSQNDDVVVARLKGVVDRNMAEDLKGHALLLERSKLPNLDEDDFYHDDLIGCHVVNKSDQTPLGKITAVYNFGAGDMLEIKMDGGKIELIPFTKEIFPTVSVANLKVVMDLDAVVYLEANEEEGGGEQ